LDNVSVSRKVVVKHSLGLHMRPVGKFVDLASQFQSDIRVRKGDRTADGKDSMGMIMLNAPKGTELELTAEGPDADRAIDALVKFVESPIDLD